uniref:Uncharacterized LOC100177571 n=1 Tax=Ciona intestinalis TaxID=7719 RepID=A0A1W2WAY3_CIOIN|nr:uncharacterized protein LOC100177571 isoform X1 [Ciona intestinalis]XP_009857610.1 uncharacterized protein LOC100177571 isoform X2 [Ciona intestinalis]|eukprot:XP_002128069.1 uncharacterized protein LOC100177571 isoform X1 [Ciona intestinalis]
MDRKLLLLLFLACLILVEVEGARRRRWGIHRRRCHLYRRRYYYWGTHCYRRRWGYYRRRRAGDISEQPEMEEDVPEDHEPEQEMKPENDFEETAEQFDNHE